jgi:hypothetical protein
MVGVVGYRKDRLTDFGSTHIGFGDSVLLIVLAQPDVGLLLTSRTQYRRCGPCGSKHTQIRQDADITRAIPEVVLLSFLRETSRWVRTRFAELGPSDGPLDVPTLGAHTT